MSKVHVLIPFTTQVACGAPSHYANALCRESVTCDRCKDTDWFKKLPNAKTRYRKSKREQRA